MTQPRRRKTEEPEPEQQADSEPEAEEPEEAEPEEPENGEDELDEEEEEPGLSLRLTADRVYIALPRDGDEADTLEALAKVVDALP